MSDSQLKASGSASSSGSSTTPVDYYAVLGIEKNASRTDVKKASVSYTEDRFLRLISK